MYLLLALNIAVAQDCPNPVSSQDLDTQLDSVAIGFLEVDLDKIKSGLDSIQAKIPCLTETLDTQVAHEYHMLNGIYNYYTGDEESAVNSLRLAKRLAPGLTVPTHLFEEGHEIPTTYTNAEYIELDPDIPVSDRGVYIFNGQTVNRALNTTNIVQIREGSNILLSGIVKAGEPLPKAPAKVVSETTAPVITETVEVPETIEIPSKKSSGLIFWTSGVAVSTAGMIGTRVGFCGGLSGDCPNGTKSTSVNATLKVGNYLFAAGAVGSAIGLTKSMMNKESE